MQSISKKINQIKKDNFWKTFFKNSFWAFTGETSASLINLVVSIILIHIIGNDKYGILILSQTYMQIMDVLINIQSWRSVIQYGQKALIKRDISSFNAYIKLGCIMDVSTAIICFIVSLLIVPFIGKIIGWSPELIICAQIFSITIVSHFAGTPTAILRLMDKFKLVAVDKFISALIKVIGVVVCYYIFNKMDLKIAVIIFTISDVIGNILLVIFAFYQFNKKYSFNKMIKSPLPSNRKEFINYTLWGTFAEIVDLPVNYVDVFVVSILGNSMVAIYKVFKQIVGILNKFTSPMQQSILPQFSELAASGKKKRGFDIVIKLRNTIIKYALPTVLLVGFSSIIWLKIIYGDIYSNYWYILLVYLIIQTFALSYTAIHPFFISLGNTKKEAIITLASNVVYLILAYIFVRIIGLIGVIFAFAIQVFIAIYCKYKSIKKVLLDEKKQ